MKSLLSQVEEIPDEIASHRCLKDRYHQESLLPGSEEAFMVHDSRFEIPDKQQVKGVLSCSSITKETLPLLAEETGDGDVQREPLLASIVTGIGAGIYEELVFRLILICVLMLLFQDVLGLNHRSSIVLSVLVSAGLFSAHHHIVFVNGQLALSAAFNWTEFGFRTIAGIYFAGLFAIRGFGIAAGTHAFYDIIATIINAAFFSSIN
jgi:hypothetical protein